jgi:hypothetical protein
LGRCTCQKNRPRDNGDLALSVHTSGARYAIRLFDKNSKLAKDFTGSQWYPIDS